jgi:hypothetical protein
MHLDIFDVIVVLLGRMERKIYSLCPRIYDVLALEPVINVRDKRPYYPYKAITTAAENLD